MRFDLFYEMAMPDFLGRSDASAFQDCIAEVRLADSLGFNGAWFVEHHFSKNYSHLSKPDLLIAALSQCTQNLRLGLGVIPLPYHHVIHVAERIATLDILSSGRLEVGLGRGFSPQEYRVFGRDMQDSRALVEESLAILKLSFKNKPFQFDGQFYRFPEIEILPYGVQAPHPPLWGAAVSPQSFHLTGRRGLNLLVGPFKPWFMVKHDMNQYRISAPVQSEIGLTVGVVCLPDARRARELAARALVWFYKELYKTVLPVLEKLYPGYEHYAELGRFRELIKYGANLALLETFGMVVVGDAKTCVRALQKYEAHGVTRILCAFGAGALPSETVRESLHYFSQEVLPEFK